MQATMTTKGQVTIPATIRRQLKLTPGAKLDFFVNDQQHLEATPQSNSVIDLKGLLGKPKRTLTLEQMEDAIASGACS